MSIPKNKDDFEFTARMNIIYHEKKERKYSQIINWVAFFSIIFSSSALISFTNILPLQETFKDCLLIACALIVSIGNGLILAFNINNSLIIHSELKKKWMDFLGTVSISKEITSDIKSKFLDINMSEPPLDKKLLKKSFKECEKALGYTT